MSTYAAYPLSPMQSGMLYQSLLAEGRPEHAGYDIEQVQITLPELLDWNTFADAWSEVVNRHAALSSCFKWKNVAKPEQAPQSAIRVPLSVVDWSHTDLAVSRRDFLQADRQRGFKLDTAPLMRVTAALVGGERCEIYWTVHHILLDGRSFAQVLHEVFLCYMAKQAGHAPRLDPVRKEYADYIHWLAQRDHGASLAFFRNLLAGKSSPTPLPLANVRARLTAAPEYHEYQATLDAVVYERLARLASDHQTTMGSILQAAWGVLLARVTGDMDVVYGITRSCRYSALEGQGESIIGVMINTLPARVKVNDDDTLGALLTTTRQQWIAQREHDQTPLMDVQSQSEVGAGVPLFETLLMYDNRELNRSLRDMNPVWQQRSCTVYEQPSVPLTLIATDSGGLHLKLLFDRRHFDDIAIQRLLNYLQVTLTSMATARTVGDIDILPDPERQQILYQWNDTVRGYADTLLIHQLFEARVDAAPEAVAVDVEGQLTTYGELEQRANQLAHALRARGLGPGRYVGICLSRGVDLVVAMLGIAKSGAAYLPIDPEYPRDRIAFMLEDTAAALVVTEGQYSALFTETTLRLDDAEVGQSPTSRPTPLAQPGDLCYAIYTSGSTGKPKGVILTHTAVVNTLEWVSRTFEVGPGDRALFVTSPCFDLSVYDVFGVLGAGGTVVVATTACLREPRELVRVLVERGITIWDSAPAALQRLVTFFPAHGGSHLRLVMLSGDWIPLTLPDAVRTSFPRAKVMSLGGATEAAIWSNWFPIGAIDPSWTSIPYGRPIQNAQYYVLDKRCKPVPVGVSGDLYISGTCLAQGYLNRAELTAERFVTNPFRPGERMYMTGDLARYFPDGELEFLGRADFQVKIRGYRIELGEIEAALLAMKGVRDALCSAFVDISGAKALVAYVTAKDGQSLAEAQIKQQLQRTLPDFMVPARVMVLPAMPLSSNGKVDRKALPSPLHAASTDEYLAPRTDAEQRMAAIWEQLLERKRIGLNDRFFALGGDSLLAVSLAVTIEQEFNIHFPLARILELPTLGAMAAAVCSTQPKPQHSHVVSLNANGTRTPLFLFCGAGGFGFFFHDVAQRLGPDQPVHVLHAIGAEDESEGTEHSIEEMAAMYLQEIRAICPQGPVVIGGYSFGALAAYEVSRQLLASGQHVPLVISFDGPAPGHPQLLPLVPRIKKHLTDWWQLDSSARRDYLFERVANVKRRFQRLENDMRLAPESIDPVMAERLRRIAAGLWRARDRYKPSERIGTDLLLLQTEVPLSWPGCRTNAVYGWDEFIKGGVNVVTVPGSHLEFFGDSNNQLMANTIREFMDERCVRMKESSSRDEMPQEATAVASTV